MGKKLSNTDMKKQAADARNRLSKGYWTEVCAQRDQALKAASHMGKDRQGVMQYFQERCTHEIAAMSNPIDGQQEKQYQLVKEALDRDGEIANPVALLADKSLMKTLNDSERQRYVFSVTNLYTELKKRYLRERALLDGIKVESTHFNL